MDKLEKLLAAQRDLKTQISRQKKLAKEREIAKSEARAKEIGDLAIAAGLSELSNEILAVRFAEISAALKGKTVAAPKEASALVVGA